jgi:hypothetical protein
MTEKSRLSIKIACLAWGSLVWDPRQLPVHGQWFKDGPSVRVEFARQSDDGRITLVIDPRADAVPVLWARMVSSNLDKARQALREREGITATNWQSRIGSWKRTEPPPHDIPELPKWAEAHDLDGIVWTALAPRFHGKNKSPSADEVLEYLRGLSGNALARAREYVELAPRQIDTDYRRRIAATLGWTCRTVK